jgi:hypothetical protein
VADFVVPTTRAVFLCLRVAEVGHGNAHLAWVFDAIRPEAYPHEQAIICVVVQLSDGLGEVPISIEVTRLPEGATEEPRRLMQTAPTFIHFADRLGVHRAILRLVGCPFPEPGRYLVEVYCGRVCIGDAPIRLHPVSKESPS